MFVILSGKKIRKAPGEYGHLPLKTADKQKFKKQEKIVFMDSLNEAWDMVLEYCKKQISSTAYKSWLANKLSFPMKRMKKPKEPLSPILTRTMNLPLIPLS